MLSQRKTASSQEPLAQVMSGDRKFLVIAFGVAALLRLAYVAFGARMPWPDTLIYMEAARELRGLRHISADIVMPLYPMLLATVGWTAAPVVQAFLSATTVVLTYLIAREIFASRAVARWAAGLAAVEPLSVFYANQRMTETLFTLILCAALLALYRRRLLLGSVLLVASVLVRPTIDLLAPVLVAMFGLREVQGRHSIHHAARCLALYGVVYVALMSPWWLHNWEKYGRFVHLNLGDGTVLRMEHNPIFVERGFWNQLDFVSNEFADEVDPVERNRKRRDAAVAFIREDPMRYAQLTWRRLGRYWSPMLDQSEEDDLLGRARWPFFFATCIIYAGVFAYATQRREHRWRRIAPLLVVISYLTLVHAAINAIVRYRTPLMPLVTVIAAAGWQRATQRHASAMVAA